MVFIIKVNFIIKPEKGGSPAIASIFIIIKVFMSLFFLDRRSFILFVFIKAKETVIEVVINE